MTGMSAYKRTSGVGLLAVFCACYVGPSVQPRAEIDASRQLVVVVTPTWTSTAGTMTRFERAAGASAWSRVESAVPIVVGRTGLAWGVGFDDVSPAGPHKSEGDGKAPAGIFSLDTALCFSPPPSLRPVALSYRELFPNTASAH